MQLTFAVGTTAIFLKLYKTIFLGLLYTVKYEDAFLLPSALLIDIYFLGETQSISLASLRSHNHVSRVPRPIRGYKSPAARWRKYNISPPSRDANRMDLTRVATHVFHLR